MFAAAHGHLAAAADLKNAILALVEHLKQAFDLALHAGHLDYRQAGLGWRVVRHVAR